MICKSNCVVSLCVCAILFSVPCHAQGEEDSFGLWSISENASLVTNRTSQIPSASSPDGSLGQDYCYILLRFYQKVLSVVTISHCPMIPSCSRYSMAAVEKHGPFVGVMMTADRLYHEGSERYWTPIVRDGGNTKFLDPVENNDFWWFHENN